MDFKNQWDVDKDKSQDDTVKDTDTEKTVEQPKVIDAITPPAAASTPSSILSSIGHSSPAFLQDTAHKARRFLIAYMTTVFSAIVILYGSAWLGYVLFDHFFGPKRDDSGWFYFDFAPLYLSAMATLTVFAAIYIIASRYVTKSASDDTIGLKDWRAYKVVYAIFTALLVTTGASVIAGLLYIPLAQLMIAEDMQSKQILVQVLASIHVLAWIALLVWQERLVKQAKHSWLQGFIVVAGVLLVVIITGIFPVGSKTNERYDHRAEQDLASLQSKITAYKSANTSALPSDLTALKFDDDDPLKGRLNNYTYTIKTPSSQTSSSDSSPYSSLYQDDTSSSTDSSSYSALLKSMSQTTQMAARSYELCATFRTDTTTKTDSQSSSLLSAALGSSGSDVFTKHKADKVCFTRN